MAEPDFGSPRLRPLAGLGPDELRVSELFASLQGEGARSGLPTVFIRLTACDLRCNYCDAAHAFAGGEILPLAEVVRRTRATGMARACVTGGEPLLQSATPALCAALLAAGMEVSIETHGGLPVDALPAAVARVVDVKTPGSSEAASFLADNLRVLNGRDELKFVLSDRADYEFARDFIVRHAPLPCPALFSPVPGRLEGGTLADWILADRLEVRLQIQLHKILWGGDTRR